MRKLISGYSEELLRGVASVAGLRIAGVLIGYLFVLVVARKFGASALGEYQLTVQIVSTCALFSAMGFNQLALKYASRLKSSEISWVLFSKLLSKWALVSTFVASCLSALLAFYSNEIAALLLGGGANQKYVLFASFLVPFQVLTNLSVEILRGIGKIPLSEYIRSIHVRAMNIGVLFLLFILLDATADLVVISYLLSSFSAFLVVAWVILKNKEKTVGEDQLGHPADSDVPTFRESLGQSFPMYQSAILVFASTQALVYLLAYFESPAEVAKYNVALQVASLANFIFASVVTVSAPMYSRDYQESRQSFEKSIRESSKLIFWASGSVSLAIAVLSYPVLLVFGQEFSGSWPVLVVLAAANFVNALTGASGNLLDMTGGHKIRKNVLLINAAMTIVIAVICVQLFGAFGIALAYFFNMCFGNFVGVYIVYKKMGINMMYIPLVSSRS